MDPGNWLSDIGHLGWLFIGSIPDAFWLAYHWAKEWQGLLGGFLLIIAAWIFSRGSLRAARIRATAMIRSAQIAAGGTPNPDLRPAAAMPAARPEAVPLRAVSPESELLQKAEQLRSLIRSAMSTLTAETGPTGASTNFYCEKIAHFRFDENNLSKSLTPTARELHQKLLLQLAVVRRATEKHLPQAELSHALVQLNASARELAAVLTPALGPANAGPARAANLGRQ